MGSALLIIAGLNYVVWWYYYDNTALAQKGNYVY